MKKRMTAHGEAEPVALRIPMRAPPGAALPNGFTPLHLLLQPGGMCLELAQAEIIVGRHSSADLQIPLPDVSRRHCCFRFTAGGWEVDDLKSLNGVCVNNERVDRKKLCPEDTVTIGRLSFIVQASSRGAEDSHRQSNMLQRIAKVLPTAHGEVTEEYRKAS